MTVDQELDVIRGRARRFAARCPYCRNHPGQDIRDGMVTSCPDCGGSSRVTPDMPAYADGVVANLIAPLDDHELDALLGWVHREMGREFGRRTKARERAISIGCRLGLSDGWRERAEALALVQREQLSRSEPQWDGLADNDREALAYRVMITIGAPLTDDHHGEHGLAWTLCEQAAARFGGWPT